MFVRKMFVIYFGSARNFISMHDGTWSWELERVALLLFARAVAVQYRSEDDSDHEGDDRHPPPGTGEVGQEVDACGDVDLLPVLVCVPLKVLQLQGLVFREGDQASLLDPLELTDRSPAQLREVLNGRRDVGGDINFRLERLNIAYSQ